MNILHYEDVQRSKGHAISKAYALSDSRIRRIIKTIYIIQAQYFAQILNGKMIE